MNKKRITGMAIGMLAIVSMSYGTTYTWTGAVDGNWSNDANWDASGIPVDSIVGTGNDAGLSFVAEDDDLIIFDGTIAVDTNFPGIGGGIDHDTPTMQFNSGGTFDLHVNGRDNSVWKNIAENTTLMTVGDGIRDAGDVTVNISGMNYLSRHTGNVVNNFQVNADGILTFDGDIDFVYSDKSDRHASFTIDGGAVVVQGVPLDLGQYASSFVSFTAIDGSFTADFGSLMTNISAVSSSLVWQNNSDGVLDFTDNQDGSYTVSAIYSSVLAAINVSTNKGIIPLEIVFDGTGSTPDAGIVSYSWDFGDGTVGSGDVVSKTYASVGEYSASLTVVDSQNNSNTTSVVITTAGPATNIVLVADTANSSAGYYGTGVEKLVTDPFNYDPHFPSLATPSLEYSDGFHGREANGADVTLSFTLQTPYTTVDSMPVIALDIWGRNRDTDRDDDIDILLFNGDYSTLVGRVDGVAVADDTFYGRGIINTVAPGTTFDRIQVIGHMSHEGTDNRFTLTEVRLAAVDGVLNPLVSEISVSVDSGYVPLEVNFDASGSVVMNEPATYLWDFGNGDGASGVQTTYTYDTLGEYTATLTIVDALNNSNSAATVISVNPPIEPSIVISTNDIAVPAVIGFDASGSWANDGTASYSWDFGDGNMDSGVAVSNTYMSAGIFTATLTVTDDLGKSSSVSTNIITFAFPENVVYSSVQLTDDNDVPTNGPAVSAIDLGQTAFMEMTDVSGVRSSGDPVEGLFSGSTTNEVELMTAARFTLNFDISVYKYGFDITRIDTVMGSSTALNGRSNQGYTVGVTYMDGSTEQILGKRTWEDNLDPTTYWTVVSFSNSMDGVIASGVKSITFDNFDAPHALSASDKLIGREFDIFGIPSEAPNGPELEFSDDGSLVWFTGNVKEYEVKVCTDLAFGPWTTFTNVTATPPSTSIELPMDSDAAEFFRVIEAE